jgi:hypothetical protein
MNRVLARTITVWINPKSSKPSSSPSRFSLDKIAWLRFLHSFVFKVEMTEETMDNWNGENPHGNQQNHTTV